MGESATHVTTRVCPVSVCSAWPAGQDQVRSELSCSLATSVPPSAEKAAPEMKAPPESVARRRPAGVQSRHVRSADTVATTWPPGAIRTAVTWPPWPCR